MFEKVNPCHQDKVADRIAGALVDYAYTQDDNPKIAVEVLIGHGQCNIISETSVHIPERIVSETVERICNDKMLVYYKEAPQDIHLADNQKGTVKCGDNGIFKGLPVTKEQRILTNIAMDIYKEYPFDGKYVIDLDTNKLIICQSNVSSDKLREGYNVYENTIINPLGDWTGGTGVDTGLTNRKLGSDMGDAVTGGGLHGKDLSKADVSVNIYAHLLAQETKQEVKMCCAIGDENINGIPFAEIVEKARAYVMLIGGFEKLAEWGLI
jgi:S-adenosylmethionine synthetase